MHYGVLKTRLRVSVVSGEPEERDNDFRLTFSCFMDAEVLFIGWSGSLDCMEAAKVNIMRLLKNQGVLSIV